jgi:hypothetical protein
METELKDTLRQEKVSVNQPLPNVINRITSGSLYNYFTEVPRKIPTQLSIILGFVCFVVPGLLRLSKKKEYIEFNKKLLKDKEVDDFCELKLIDAKEENLKVIKGNESIFENAIELKFYIPNVYKKVGNDSKVRTDVYAANFLSVTHEKIVLYRYSYKLIEGYYSQSYEERYIKNIDYIKYTSNKERCELTFGVVSPSGTLTDYNFEFPEQFLPKITNFIDGLSFIEKKEKVVI